MAPYPHHGVKWVSLLIHWTRRYFPKTLCTYTIFRFLFRAANCLLAQQLYVHSCIRLKTNLTPCIAAFVSGAQMWCNYFWYPAGTWLSTISYSAINSSIAKVRLSSSFRGKRMKNRAPSNSCFVGSCAKYVREFHNQWGKHFPVR